VLFLQGKMSQVHLLRDFSMSNRQGLKIAIGFGLSLLILNTVFTQATANSTSPLLQAKNECHDPRSGCFS
jgi:hypothetical protein